MIERKGRNKRIGTKGGAGRESGRKVVRVSDGELKEARRKVRRKIKIKCDLRKGRRRESSKNERKRDVNR